MPRIDVRGSLIPNDYKWFYDWFEEDSTCPRDVQKVLNELIDGEDLDVYINSPGGVIDVGSEIYTLLRDAGSRSNLKIHITGEACSAASIVAMAGHCEMAPTALMMVHCVSTGGVRGNHSKMEHVAEMLRTADNALCTAYMAKSNMTREDALAMMEHETWLTAEQAKEKGLIDEIMFDEPSEGLVLHNAVGFKLPTMEQMERVKAMMASQEPEEIPEPETVPTDRSAEFNCKMRMLKMRARKLS